MELKIVEKRHFARSDRKEEDSHLFWRTTPLILAPEAELVALSFPKMEVKM